MIRSSLMPVSCFTVCTTITAQVQAKHTCFVTDHKQSSREDDRQNEIALRGRDPTPDLVWKLEEIRRHKLRKTIFPDVAE